MRSARPSSCPPPGPRGRSSGRLPSPLFGLAVALAATPGALLQQLWLRPWLRPDAASGLQPPALVRPTPLVPRPVPQAAPGTPADGRQPGRPAVAEVEQVLNAEGWRTERGTLKTSIEWGALDRACADLPSAPDRAVALAGWAQMRPLTRGAGRPLGCQVTPGPRTEHVVFDGGRGPAPYFLVLARPLGSGPEAETGSITLHYARQGRVQVTRLTPTPDGQRAEVFYTFTYVPAPGIPASAIPSVYQARQSGHVTLRRQGSAWALDPESLSDLGRTA